MRLRMHQSEAGTSKRRGWVTIHHLRAVSFLFVILTLSLKLTVSYSLAIDQQLKPLNLKKAQLLSARSSQLVGHQTSLDRLNDDSLPPARRIRRQANSGANQQGSSGVGPAVSGSNNQASGGLDSQAVPGQGDPNSSEQPSDAPEVFASLKCDFGSADAPELCKFKILDSDSAANPLSRTSSLASWTLGSGRLALFQGGPLIDASGLQAGSNETSGAYIFYETSNPFATTTSNMNNNSAMTMNTITHVHDSYTVPHLPNTNQHGYKPLGAYATSGNHDQIITSQRVSVSPSATVASSGGGLQAAQMYSFAGPSFMTPNLTAPGPSGMCLSFQYAIQGLSAEELRIYLSDQKTGRMRQIWASSESAASNWTRGEVLYSVTNQHALVFSAISSNAIAKDLQQRKFRGHLALDDIEVQKHDPLASGEQAACRGHCNFDGDLCGWTNGENGQDDDFDWSFGRGSDNLFTGPARDFTSSSNNELTGSFLFTDSGYPRRPGDRALLLSPMFQPTLVNDAMCMRFAVHMFGSGIGSLAIKIRYADEGALAGGPETAGSATNSGSAGGQAGANNQSPSNQASATSGFRSANQASNDLVIWEMSGDAGNSWHQAQTSVSSAKSAFQVVIEGVIGENHLGDIAIDELSFSQGPCPTSPPVASKNYGDCTFEQSMCYWRNPDADIHLDDLDWLRQADETSIHGPNFDHTLKKRSGSYLKLENTFREPKSGTRAFLLSPVFSPKSSNSVQCLSFYYYMFMRSISSSGPNLGTIRVYLASNNELVPIWRLTNPISSPNWKHARASLSTAIVDGQPQAPTKLFQIAFEGIWGDAASGAIALDDITVFDGACDIMPPEARSVPGECTFDVDLCSWSNKSASYEMGPNGQIIMPDGSASMGNEAAILDSSRSPFLQSVGSNTGSGGSMSGAPGGSRSNLAAPYSHHNRHSSSTTGRLAGTRMSNSWQLATVDSRPVNLQDHTYKAPIGYAYVDVLDSGDGSGARLAYPLQSAEVTVQSGQIMTQCLSFWFAAYGRQDLNRLSVYLTQASAPPAAPDDASEGTGAPAQPSNRNSGGTSQQAGSNNNPSASIETASVSAAEAEQASAWKFINGKLIWTAGLRNITESLRRKWLYGQVTIKADSNHIVRFVAISNDGGFALDDVSYFDGACETRPNHARVLSVEEEANELANTGGPGGSVGGGSGSVPNSSGGTAGAPGASTTSGGGGSGAAGTSNPSSSSNTQRT